MTQSYIWPTCLILPSTGIEIKVADTATAADFKGLQKLKSATGKRFVRGIVLYDGDAVASFGDGMLAVPISMLWEMQ